MILGESAFPCPLLNSKATEALVRVEWFLPRCSPTGHTNKIKAQIPIASDNFSSCSATLHILFLFLIEPLWKHLFKYSQPRVPLTTKDPSSGKYQGAFLTIHEWARAFLSDSIPRRLALKLREVETNESSDCSGSSCTIW